MEQVSAFSCPGTRAEAYSDLVVFRAIAGKSNVMDAICFVLGVNAKNIRADKLKDLVFKVEGKPGKVSNEAAPSLRSGANAHLALLQVNEASVTMHYVLTAGEIENYTEDTVLEFMRTVTAKGTSEYFIQGNKLDAKDYSTALAELRIDTKARNFLVFQGDVGQLADKSSAELVAYFELVSGSAELKPEYELTQTQLEEARQLCNQKKKIAQEASKEKVEVLKHKESAELYKKLSDDIEKLQTQIALTRLFFYEAQIATEVSPFPCPNSPLAYDVGAVVPDSCSHPCRRPDTRPLSAPQLLLQLKRSS